MNAAITPTSFGKPSSISIAAQGGITSSVSASFGYNGSGLLSQMSIPGTSQSASVNTTVMSYSSDGQPLTVNNYVNASAYLTTTYSYDAAGRKIGEQDYRGTWTCYYYDSNDNLTDIAAGITSACPSSPPPASESIRHNHIEYDAENRVTARSEGYGSAVQRTMSYTYEGNSGVLAYIYDHNNSRRKEFGMTMIWQ
ncbi:MAG: hypothetical protein HC887_02025 [Desulfobacteraceae bacterium]|nr:hypothetical protein [Desulfobacteraceae bacterium]